jgi:hypothetical protein
VLDLSFQHDLLEAGCDEAGRGCLAGAVFAAAVILPPDFSHPLLNDSKQMSEKTATFCAISSVVRLWLGLSRRFRQSVLTR